MGNEAKTENLVREALRQKGYYDNKDIIVEEKKSDNPKIDKLLKNASKKGNKQGYPEFIISSRLHSDFAIVVECKADTSKHASEKLDCYADYAVDGALLYASFLAKEFDVIAIAVSGEDVDNSKISHYLYLRNDVRYSQVFGSEILPFDNYYNAYVQMPQKFNQDFKSLVDYSLELNKLLHTKRVKESQRSLLISGILIALQNQAFRQGYKGHKTAQHLVDNLVKTIIDELSTVQLNGKNIANLTYAFSFIKTHSTLSTDKQLIEGMISEMDNRINSFLKTHHFDAIGRFYVEFLRYANSDKGLGIVLTPPHITSLFAELADVNQNSVVVDNCCGTTGFLISAMNKMVADAKGNEATIRNVKNCQLAGIEIMGDIYALAISNMILHGDGKANIYQADCFTSINLIKGKYKPTIGLLNPPYKVKKEDREELEYILNNLEMLEPNGICIAIVPMSCALAHSGKPLDFKKQLLEKHTLEAVMSMPNDLFHDSDIGVVTCVMVVKAHSPHPAGYKTWFGFWKNDGFVKTRRGRIDSENKWEEIQREWVRDYRNRNIKTGYSVRKEIEAKSEWCVEAYMETDYSLLNEDDFRRITKDYIAYKFLSDDTTQHNISSSAVLSSKYNLNVRAWQPFRIGDYFNIATGKDKPKYDIGTSICNSVENLTTNNGVNGKIGYANDKIHSSFISVVSIGEGGHAFYQSEPSAIFTRVKALLPKEGTRLNTYTGLFLVAVIRLEKIKYSYGRVLDEGRLKETHIKLPSQNDSPDWQFMEDYIKSLPYSSNL